MNQASDSLRAILRSFLEGELSEREFCEQYERCYNLEADRSTVGPTESGLFEELFNEVVYYSPFAEDRRNYPGYRDERAIRKIALKVWTALHT